MGVPLPGTFSSAFGDLLVRTGAMVLVTTNTLQGSAAARGFRTDPLHIKNHRKEPFIFVVASRIAGPLTHLGALDATSGRSSKFLLEQQSSRPVLALEG
jgi:hypothetical protein